MTRSNECPNCGKPNNECCCWEFPGWGKIQYVTDLEPLEPPPQKQKLGQWLATAICGNDITSSCLYVSALAALYAGPLAPVALLVVAGVLFLFRGIYAEVGSALPFNGGAYNLLLNTTTKWRAALAACLTILSYIATAVISGSEAMHYAADFFTDLDIFRATVSLLVLFALLNFLGIAESATVALMIFVFHILTLTGLVLIAFLAFLQNPQILFDNLQTPMDQWPMPRRGGIVVALFFGISAAMLGISGFESSANYIEEQKSGVFPKTLRNMWIAVAIFNPLISLLSLSVFSLDEIADYKEALLSTMGHHSMMRIAGAKANDFGPRLVSQWISFDAVVVLSGAVLTSFVGVTGLMKRMSLDDCLPRFLLRSNRWRGTNHWIIGLFLALCVSILTITDGDIEMLAGVYTLSFLSVMALFAGGNLLLKGRHPTLVSETRASVPGVLVALFAVLSGIIGNILINPRHVRVFFIYLAAAVATVAFVFFRHKLITFALKGLNAFFDWPFLRRLFIRPGLVSILHDLQCRRVIYVHNGQNIDEISHAAEYVLRNEQVKFMQVVWMYEDESNLPADITDLQRKIDRQNSQLHIDFVLVKSPLELGAVQALANRFAVPINHVFVSSKTATEIADRGELGGVRIIF